jgi:hypothetical protein
MSTMRSLGRAISEKIVAPYSNGSISNSARRRRWELFARRFPEISQMHVLDIGGDARAWRSAGVRPRHLTLVNLFEQEVEGDWMSSVAADACDLPEHLTADLVYCNSVIEHVGGHWRRQRMAEGIRRAAPRYWVQTPYRYFPIEPHFLIPFVQHLPKAAQARVIARWPLGNYDSVTDRDVALRSTMQLELLSVSELKVYFPDAEIERERIGGLTKSLIAIR